jgi:hypothetical protein
MLLIGVDLLLFQTELKGKQMGYFSVFLKRLMMYTKSISQHVIKAIRKKSPDRSKYPLCLRPSEVTLDPVCMD